MNPLHVYTYKELRPELDLLTITKSAPLDWQWEALQQSGNPCVRCLWIKAQGDDDVFKKRRYKDAIDKYILAMREIVPRDFALPAAEYINDTYMQFLATSGGQWKEHLDLVECCEGIARCYLGMRELTNAMDWLQEIEILYICQRMASRPDHLPFMHVHVYVENHYAYRMQAENLYSSILYELGNTATSTFFAHRSMCIGCMVDKNKLPRIEELKRESDAVHKVQLRHPEPTYVDRWSITEPQLQVRGAWTKLDVASGPVPQSRFGFSSWIWRSKLYVTGGQHWTMADHVDLWCFDVASPTKKWRRLADPRAPHLNQVMKVWDNKAWMFSGTIKWVVVFDLVTEKWSTIPTKFKGKAWPFGNNLMEYCMEIFEDVMYVFGGTDDRAELGNNVLMALDLRTLVWRHLGGTTEANATNTMPMLRRFASSWVVPSQKRLYILYGNIGRQNAYIARRPHGTWKIITMKTCGHMT